MRLVIRQARHLFLLHERDLILIRSKVVVALEQIQSLLVRVVGRHDGQRNLIRTSRGTTTTTTKASARPTTLRARRVSFLKRQNILDVQFQIARIRRALHRKLHLDTRVPETLTETTGNEHKARLCRLFHPNLLQNHVRRRTVFHNLTRGHARRPPLKRILPLLTRRQQPSRVLHVLGHATGIPRIRRHQLRRERSLLLVIHTDRGPRFKEVRLAEINQTAHQFRLVRVQHSGVGVRRDFRRHSVTHRRLFVVVRLPSSVGVE